MADSRPLSSRSESERIGQAILDLSARLPEGFHNLGPQHERSHTKTRMEVLEWHADLEQLLARLDREWSEQEWKAVPGSHCSTCAAPGACPIPVEWRNHAGSINTVEEATEAIEWAERTGDRVAAVRREVKEFAKAHGPIPCGRDQEFGPVVSESVRLRQRKGRTDVEGLREAVEAAVEYGAPFEAAEFFREQVSTSWKVHRRAEGHGGGRARRSRVRGYARFV